MSPFLKVSVGDYYDNIITGVNGLELKRLDIRKLQVVNVVQAWVIFSNHDPL